MNKCFWPWLVSPFACSVWAVGVGIQRLTFRHLSIKRSIGEPCKGGIVWPVVVATATFSPKGKKGGKKKLQPAGSCFLPYKWFLRVPLATVVEWQFEAASPFPRRRQRWRRHRLPIPPSLLPTHLQDRLNGHSAASRGTDWGHKPKTDALEPRSAASLSGALWASCSRQEHVPFPLP